MTTPSWSTQSPERALRLYLLPRLLIHQLKKNRALSEKQYYDQNLHRRNRRHTRRLFLLRLL